MSQTVAQKEYELGDAYMNGKGVERNKELGVEHVRRAADKGHADAQYKLGFAYDWGYGVEKDLEEAAKWYHKAAEQGHADAHYALGLAYYNGYGVEQDYMKAAEWFRKAADKGHGESEYDLELAYQEAAKQGNVDAQYELGVMHSNGNFVEKDLEEAVKWFRKAADKGHKKAEEELDSIMEAKIMEVSKLTKLVSDINNTIQVIRKRKRDDVE